MSANFSQGLELRITAKLDSLAQSFNKIQTQVQGIFRKIENSTPKKLKVLLDEKSLLNQAEKTRNTLSQIYNKTTVLNPDKVKKQAATTQSILQNISKPLSIPIKIATAPLIAMEKIGVGAFNMVKNAGVGTFVAIGAALYAFQTKFGESLKTFYEFDKQMGLIWTISDFGGDLHDQKKKLDEFGKDVQKIAINTAGEISDIAKSAYWTISAGVQEVFGYTRDEVLKIAEIGAKASTASDAPSATVTKALALMVNTYGADLGKSATDRYSRAADILFKGQELGIMSVQDMATYQGKIIGMSKALGISPEDQAAYTIALSRGMNPAESFTAYSGMLSTIASPSQEAKDYADKIGLDFSVGNMQAMGLPAFLQKLNSIMGKDPEAEAKLFGNVRALRGLMNVFSDESWKNYKIIANEFRGEKLSGSMERAHEKMRETEYFKKDEMQTRHQIVQANIGKAVAPAWLDMQKTGYQLLDYVSLEISKSLSSQEELKNIVKESDALISQMGEKTKSWAKVLTAAVETIIGIGKGINAIVTTVTPAISQAVSYIMPIFLNLKNYITDVFSEFAAKAAPVFEQVKKYAYSLFYDIIAFGQNAFSFLTSLWNTVSPMLLSAGNFLLPIIEDIWTIIKGILTFASRIINKIFELEARLGLVSNILKIIVDILAIPLAIVGKIFSWLISLIAKMVEWEERTRIVSSVFEGIGYAVSGLIWLVEKVASGIIKIAEAIGLVRKESIELKSLSAVEAGSSVGAVGAVSGFLDNSSVRSSKNAGQSASEKFAIKEFMIDKMNKGVYEREQIKNLLIESGHREIEVNRALEMYYDDHYKSLEDSVRSVKIAGFNGKEIYDEIINKLDVSDTRLLNIAIKNVESLENKKIDLVKNAEEKIIEVKENADKQKQILAREHQYKIEMSEKDHLAKMESYIKKDFARKTSLIKKEMDITTDTIKKAKSEQEDIIKNLAESRTSYIEKRTKIISSGLDQKGQDYQTRGLANFYSKKSEEFANLQKFDDAIKYAEKAQDIYATLAERKDNAEKEYDLAEFDRKQKIIEDLFQSQKFANEKIIENAAQKISNLNNDLATIFADLQQKITIKVSTDEAKFKMQELQQKFVEARKELGEYFALTELKKDFSNNENFSRGTRSKIENLLLGNKKNIDDYVYKDVDDIFGATADNAKITQIENPLLQPATNILKDENIDAEEKLSRGGRTKEQLEARRKMLREQALIRANMREKKQQLEQDKIVGESLSATQKNDYLGNIDYGIKVIEDEKEVRKALKLVAENTKIIAENTRQQPAQNIRETKIDATISSQKITQSRK